MIEDFLRSSKKTTVLLEELEALFSGASIEWSDFAAVVQELEFTEVLEAVRSAGRTAKQPSLAYRYRMNKQQMRQPLVNLLHQSRQTTHSAIQLDGYYSLSEHEYEQDKPYIERIDQYLKQYGFPSEAAPAPERSFQLVNNEKWITELGGYTLLKRLGLWERMMVQPVSDPLMMAVNPTTSDPSAGQSCMHLIVENKTTFQALLPVLPKTTFRTLIYGCGNKITGNIDMFSMQYPVKGVDHRFFYFGDLDYEGIRIWYETNRQRPMIPALIFYEACLARPFVKGKHNQRRDEAAIEAFLAYFTPIQRERIEHCLVSGGYYPQETLTTSQLQQLWRSEQWRTWIGRT